MQKFLGGARPLQPYASMAVPGNHRARFAHATTGVREQREHELENLKVFVRWLGWWGAMREKSERAKRDRHGRGAERVKMAEGRSELEHSDIYTHVHL